ncbi:type IV pilin biogenesis protein [Pseudenhygromyxa sp. WMMC2535]|nr:type IV pilin biogenesis protein [Pseudenhygromyxa sp. WMMC2535]
MLAFGVFGYAARSEARLDPFYIIRGQSFGQVKPRILFLLDNSGSMGMDETYKPGATYPDTKCWWDNCEDEDAGFLQSRIHASRQVIRELIADNEDRADFALMTFGNAVPPTSVDTIPEPCIDLDTAEERRFTWIENVNQPYSTQWKPASNPFGGQGFWLLCGDNRPFPYLRHDDLGGISMPNNSTAELADQPLYLSEGTLTDYEDSSNYVRKVQFFPRFVGRRANLDCSDSNQEAIALNSWGDWGNDDAAKLSSVCGRDFYYWPYVDGNPGYSYYDGQSANNFSHQECTDNDTCATETDETHRLGVVRRNQLIGTTLYAPFYSQAVIDDPGIAAADKGPLTTEDARLMLDGITDKQYAGGSDVTGGTPMKVAMGQPKYAVYLDADNNITGLKAVVPVSNAPFAHETVAHYLAFMRTNGADQVCRPLSLIIVTDGQPDPWWKQGGSDLYERLRDTRRMLGVKTYFIALSDGVVADAETFDRAQQMACAASGAEDITTPCAGANDLDWDTCRDPEDPANDCAYLASNHEELSEALVDIITQDVDTEVPGGAPTVANDFQLSDPDDPLSDQAAVQTSISAWTDTPPWRGHVVREACDEEDPDNPGVLTDYCQNANDLAIDTEEEESFGPCAIGRAWDAGECLLDTAPTDRRLYTHDESNQRIKIHEAGAATGAFTSLVMSLDSQGKIDPPLTAGNESAEIQAMVDLLIGVDLPDDWKLPGLSNAAPLLVRRVPEHDNNFLPSVGISDPHCAGRRNAQGDDVPDTLKSFSSQAWATTSGSGFGVHYDYAEAVLIGDDFGVLHAFHYDSGNELFGFLPMALINNARVLSVNGPSNFGQPNSLDDHVFGIASTANAGWVFDDDANKWRHLAVFGLGAGGTEIVAIDVAHMGRLQDDDPFDVLWTSSTSGIAGDYADTLGETWSRPALTYGVPNHQMSLEPKGYLVFGSGYSDGVGDAHRGRVMWVVDAITGETVTEKAYLAPPASGTTYDTDEDVAAVSDIAVSSHCLSRYWGEMEEAYVADPAGRLYRWDLATETSNVSSFPHAADSGGTWAKDGQGYALATEAFRFPACQGTGDFSCTINAIGSVGTKGDVFTYPPAVVANNRIDSIEDPGELLAEEDRDQFLIALVSGSASDAAVDGGDEDNDFHSSIYLLADDHRSPNEAAGFDIPTNAPATAAGDHSHFMRLPLNQISRTRTLTYPDDSTEVETRAFSKMARPIRAPAISVTGLAVDGIQQAVEVFYVTFTIYEPGEQSCDSRWYDDEANEWVYDRGATYEVTFRLVVEDGQAFDFQNGYTLPGTYGDGFGSGGGLEGPVVEQVGECTDGNCGAVLTTPDYSPCDPNESAPPVGGMTSIQTGSSELNGFTPLEIPL